MQIFLAFSEGKYSLINLNHIRFCLNKSLIITLLFIIISNNMAQDGPGRVYKGLTKIPIEPMTDPLPAGTYTIGVGGFFPTIESAFSQLSTAGIYGSVEFELTDEFYQSPADSFGFLLIGPIPGAGPDSRVTIKPAAEKKVIIEGTSFAVLSFYNTSYLTIDGIGREGATSLTIHSLYNSQFSYNDGLNFWGNTDHCIIRNVNFIQEDNKRACGILIDVEDGRYCTPDHNLIEDNIFLKASVAIWLKAYASSGTMKGIGNVIRGNIIGSETECLVNWGIQANKLSDLTIENNIIRNIKTLDTGYISGITCGISCYWCNDAVIRNNIVYNIYDEGALYGSAGILLSGGEGNYGDNNKVYNNMIYEIQSTSECTSSRIDGIEMWYQNNPEIYYNSVSLSGKGNGTNPYGSAALYIEANCNNADIRDNVFVNTRDDSPFCASAIRVRTGFINSISISDNNDLYYQENQYNCLVRAGMDYHTLEEWQASGKDSNSINEMPNFISPWLHVDDRIPTKLLDAAVSITGIKTDVDHQIRDILTPDIGADEIGGKISGAEKEKELPQYFRVEQNYPNPFNPSTTIGFGIQNKSNVKIRVLNTIGEEAAVILDEEKEPGYYQVKFNAAGMPSGVYFYQLKAGDFVQTKKMILLK